MLRRRLAVHAAGACAAAAGGAVPPAAIRVRGAGRGGRDGSRGAALRDVRGALRILHPGGVRGRVDVPGDLRLRGSAGEAVCDRPRGRAAADQHPARRRRGSRARPRLHPAGGLRRFGCSEEDLRREVAAAGHGVGSPAVRALLRHQAERAREYYVRAAASLPAGDARRLVAAEIMGAIYFAILRRRSSARTTTSSPGSSAFPVRGARSSPSAPGLGSSCGPRTGTLKTGPGPVPRNSLTSSDLQETGRRTFCARTRIGARPPRSSSSAADSRG